jgi:hypothetical protein
MATMIQGSAGPPSDPQNPNFRAEFSLLKTLEADPNATIPPRNPKDFPKYGERDTVRMDSFEKLKVDTACGYDIKTGEKILPISRMHEIVETIHKYWPEVDRIFMIEVREQAGVSP